MKNKVFNTILGVNTAVQAVFSLLSPIAAGALIAYFLTEKNLVGTWIYIVLILAGVFTGLISTVVFLLKVSAIERAQAEAYKQAGEDGEAEAENGEDE